MSVTVCVGAYLLWREKRGEVRKALLSPQHLLQVWTPRGAPGKVLLNRDDEVSVSQVPWSH